MTLNPILTPVTNLRRAFETGNVDLARAYFGTSLTMLNGNYSGNPEEWEAHQFLMDDAIYEWLDMMISQAEQKVTAQSFKRVHQNGDAGLIVASESGHNKFRTWEEELVTYWLGNIGGEWKIMGFFIRDMSNPE